MNEARARKAIHDAEREFGNGLRSLNEDDYTGALKYFQESCEYAAKAALIAYGLDYPRIHGVGRFLVENKGRFPKWFGAKVGEMSEVVDGLARGRPKFLYPYEYPQEEHEALAKDMRGRVERVLSDCKKLIDQLFGIRPPRS